MSEPTVSVGLPVYNGENYIEAAVRSILSQDFNDFELIISDNASTDRTSEICRHFASRDKRVKYLRLEVNCGAVKNYNRVFALSTGKYFKWAAHDDVCLPRFLSRCVEVLDETSTSVVLVYPRAEIIDAAGKRIGVDHESIASGDLRAYRRALHVVRKVNVAWAQFGVARSDALRKTRLMDGFIGSDYVLLAELAMLGRLQEIPETLFQRRLHAGVSNVAHKNRGEWLAWLDASQAGRRSRLPPSLRIGWECARSARRLPPTRDERVLCQVTVASGWYCRKLYQLGSFYKSKIAHAVGLPPEN